MQLHKFTFLLTVLLLIFYFCTTACNNFNSFQRIIHNIDGAKIRVVTAREKCVGLNTLLQFAK